ncbi:TPA_asm: hypothetical protein G2720_23770 [Salmonella enterica subsp. enterica serovar Enteritidis str. P125109]|uniref:Type I restriction modification DNA specificity domain-containing protein n=1 Tax=Salmonella enteritidis PT4 (strain P125109) TaxID=550537 RepID=A0A725B9Q2_SALEP|nr:hypothetical protein [Salmonella enterica subsp. enterica serovar Enteritidis str. P125109]
MNAKQLRKSVLQYAFKGQLTDRNPADTPVENIVYQIEEIKNAKISLKIDETLLDDPAIPDTWKWISFGELTFNKDSSRIPLSKNIRHSQKNKVYPYYGASGIIDYVDNYLFDETFLLIGEDGANLVTRSTPIAFLATGKYWVNNHAHVIGALNETTLSYVMHYINSISLMPYITGTAQPKMNQKKLNSIPVPLPPIEEQKRIVDKIEELFFKIDSYDNHYLALEALNKRFPKDLEKSILQYAIEGKLVEQDTADEPASELLKRISEQKEQMVKEKVIKKEKPLPPITEDEIPFDIPETWQWVRLKNISTFGNFNQASPEKINPDDWVLDLEEIEKNTGRILEQKTASEKTIKSNKYKFNKDDVLYGKLRPYLNKVTIAPREGYCTTEIFPITLIEGVYPKYIQSVLMSPYFLNYAHSLSYGVKMPRLGTAQIANALIPLPPTNEQIKIIEKIEEMTNPIRNLSLSNDR